LGSNIFFGSFGVPIKSPAVVAAKVDPVVFQLYKSTACFTTCWLALLYVDFKITIWGFVGAAIWVVNGTLAILAIQKAGLGVAQSTWSGLSIFVSFFWGAVVFGEPVRSMTSCLFALVLMAAGMLGLALAASGKFKETAHLKGEEEEEALLLAEDGKDNDKYSRCNNQNFKVGMAAAVYVGIANGSFMTPLKYANQEVTGLEYLISFGIGSMLMTIIMAVCYFAFRHMIGRPIPSLHLDVAAKPALLTGLMWSCGNVCSIFATEYLGIAVGWPLVQCNLLVSNFWGIFYYEEISGKRSIVAFMGSALVLLSGVVVLSVFGK